MIHSNKNELNPSQKKSKTTFFVITCLGIIFITGLIYFQSLSFPFTNWDDKDYITLNEDIRSLHGDSIGYTLKKTFSSYVMGNYHPITMLSYSIEYHFFKLEPNAYHTTNLILHIVNALLVYLFIWLLVKQKWTAFFTALLFAIHPMHVESVVWVSERKDLLYSLFLLISLIFYITYSDSKKKLFYYLTILAFILSVLSKAMAVCIPLLLILIDYFRGKKISSSLVIEKIPFFIVSIVFGIIAIFAQKSSNSINLLTTYSFFEKIMFSCYGIVIYITKSISPYNLSCFYPYPVINNNGMYPFIFYLAPFIVALLGYFIFKSLKFKKDILFGFALFIITIALVLQILPVGGAIIAERYTYVSYIGLFFIAGTFINNIAEDKIKALISLKIPIFIGVGILCILYSVLSFRQTRVWSSSIDLWKNVIEKNPASPEWVRTNLRISYTEQADKYFNNEKYSSAILLFTNYLDSKTDNATVYFKRGFSYYKLKKYDAAIKDFDLAIKYSPKYADAYFNRGLVCLEKGFVAKAINDFTKVIKIKQDYYDAYYNRGAAYSDSKKYDEAIKDYTYFLTHKKNDPKALYNRSGAHYLSQQYDKALADALDAEKAGYPVDQEYIKILKNEK